MKAWEPKDLVVFAELCELFGMCVSNPIENPMSAVIVSAYSRRIVFHINGEIEGFFSNNVSKTLTHDPREWYAFMGFATDDVYKSKLMNKRA